MARTVQYTLDKTRNLRLTMEAIENYESYTGDVFINVDLNKLSAKKMLALLWSAARIEDPELTYEQTRKLVEEYSDVASLYEKTLEVVMGTIPEPKAGGPKNAKKA